MKIGYILGLKNGIHRFIYRELCSMENFGHEISIFTTKYNKNVYNPKDNWKLFNLDFFALLISQVLSIVTNPKSYFLLFMESVKSKSVIDFLIAQNYSRKFLKNDLDLINVHFGDHKLFVGYYIKKITGLPLVCTIHAHELYRNPNWIMFKKSLNFCDKIISISDYNKNYLIDNFGVDPDKVKVVRLFVAEKDIITNIKKILVVGSLEERKGYDDLLKALTYLKRSDFVFWVVGDGHLDIAAEAKKLGVFEKLKFFGKLHADVLNILYYACDIFCLPSKTVKVKGGEDREGIPVAIMEAMAYEKPVIATDHVGISELVKEYLVPENNPKELAKIMNFLIENPELYKKQGKNNRKIIEAKYSAANIKTLEKELKSLVK